MDWKHILKPAVLILLIIALSAILIRVFSGSETLSEYAEKNPETAYEKTDSSTGQTSSHINNKVTAAATVSDNISMNDEKDNVSVTSNNSIQKADCLTDSKGDRKMQENPDRIEYKQGFYYEPLSEDMKKRITGISYPAIEADKNAGAVEAVNTVSSVDEIQIGYDDLRYVSIQHYNFKGIEKTGELICNKAIAQDLLEIFYELYENQYQIEQIHLIDEYGGDDTLSMQDNNTSCFNYRVVDGTTNLSKHALGLAIDINPFFNPYVVYHDDGTTYISPQGGEAYADRSKEFACKIDENDLCYRLFTEHGFTWGGDWNSCKDYQHFQKVPD